MTSPARPSAVESLTARVEELERALERAAAFISKASGTALGIAMSGRNHPNPDEVLTKLAQEGMELDKSARALLPKGGRGKEE